MLVEIDVPDLRQEVLQKESVVEHRRRELDLARTTIKFAKAVFVLHAFQKKSKKGIATPRKDVELIKQRYAQAKGAGEI